MKKCGCGKNLGEDGVYTVDICRECAMKDTFYFKKLKEEKEKCEESAPDVE